MKPAKWIAKFLRKIGSKKVRWSCDKGDLPTKGKLLGMFIKDLQARKTEKLL